MSSDSRSSDSRRPQSAAQAAARITRPRRIILKILRETEGHPDAGRVLADVLAEARQHPGVLGAAARHRVGELAIGDVAFVAAISAAHRREAFAACAWLVDEAKARLPIWKHQFFADGTDEWVNCP